jgi:hypothetical protein
VERISGTISEPIGLNLSECLRPGLRAGRSHHSTHDVLAAILRLHQGALALRVRLDVALQVLRAPAEQTNP